MVAKVYDESFNMPKIEELREAFYHLGSMVRDYVNGEVSRDELEDEAEKARKLSGCDDEE